MDEAQRAIDWGLVRISDWVDDGQPEDRSREALMWHRCAKVSEEAGEVIEALIGVTGGNPRKGVKGTYGDVCRELLDTAVAALAAVVHVTRAQYLFEPSMTSLLRQHVEEKIASIEAGEAERA